MQGQGSLCRSDSLLMAAQHDERTVRFDDGPALRVKEMQYHLVTHDLHISVFFHWGQVDLRFVKV